MLQIFRSLSYSSSELSSKFFAYLLLQSSSSRYAFCQNRFFLILIQGKNIYLSKYTEHTSCLPIMPLCVNLYIVSRIISSSSWQGLQKINSYLKMLHNFSTRLTKLSWSTVILFSAIATGSLICDCNSAYKAVTENIIIGFVTELK